MLKVLIVDDDPSFNKMLSVFFQKNDYDVVSVYSAKSALRELSRSIFDLILTDYKLLDINGLELISMIKSNCPEVPVILMTSYQDIRTAVKSIQLGAYEFVTKPVNPDELLLLSKRAIESKTEMKPDDNTVKSKADRSSVANSVIQLVI